MHLLVDGDIVVYRAGFAADVTYYEVYDRDLTKFIDAEPIFSSTSRAVVNEFIGKLPEDKEVFVSRRPAQGNKEAALGNCKDLLFTSIIDKLGTDSMTVFLSGSGNFREEVSTYAKYKGNRDKQRRPLHYDAIKKYLIDHWGAVVTEGEEADDALGQEQTKDTIICSIDKDLLQIMGQHYNFVKHVDTHVGYEASHRLFCMQTLTGDTTDNIFGLAGVGPKTAEKILTGDPSKWWDLVIEAYKHYLPRKPLPGMTLTKDGIEYPHWDTGKTVYKTIGEYAEEVAQLVWIRKRGQKYAPTT